MTRLPKYVQGFVDHTGAPRHYIRRQGYPRTALPGTPWSPTFMAAYEEAMAQQDDVTPPKVAGVKLGSLRALAVSYFASPAFSTLSDTSKLLYRGTLERFCKTKDANGNLYGDKPYGLDRATIVKILAARAGKPRSPINCVQCWQFSCAMRWSRDCARTIRYEKSSHSK